MNEVLKDILDEAISFAAKHKADWTDYEYFKNRLHDAGIFGHEGQLADILKL